MTTTKFTWDHLTHAGRAQRFLDSADKFDKQTISSGRFASIDPVREASAARRAAETELTLAVEEVSTFTAGRAR